MASYSSTIRGRARAAGQRRRETTRHFDLAVLRAEIGEAPRSPRRGGPAGRAGVRRGAPGRPAVDPQADHSIPAPDPGKHGRRCARARPEGLGQARRRRGVPGRVGSRNRKLVRLAGIAQIGRPRERTASRGVTPASPTIPASSPLSSGGARRGRPGRAAAAGRAVMLDVRKSRPTALNTPAAPGTITVLISRARPARPPLTPPLPPKASRANSRGSRPR